ncbi:MAG TPA: glycosyltransferase family 87 protein [Terriglobia bacterium]|nr:glycosyltransferase family 87 protein [Terriglobia bacterium]
MALVVGFALSNFAARKDKLDFPQFYCAGQIVRQGLGRSLYDLTTQWKCQSRIASVHTFYNHPPFEALFFLPLTYFGCHAAYILWTLGSLGLLVCASVLIESRSEVSLAVSQYSRMPADFGLVFILFLTFGPATTCLLIGQDSVLMLLIYTLVFVLLKGGRDFWAGCALACGLFKFQLIVPFVVILLLRRRWSALKGFATTATLLVLISTGVSGFQALTAYPRFLFLDTSYREVSFFLPEYTPNIRGLLYLLVDRRVPASAFGVSVAAFSVLALWWTARNWRDEQFDISFSASVLATILASYHLYNYDLTLVLLPITIVCGDLARRARLLSNRVLTGVLAVLFLPPLHLVLAEHGIYALMGIPVLVLFFIVVRQIHTGGLQELQGTTVTGQ